MLWLTSMELKRSAFFTLLLTHLAAVVVSWEGPRRSLHRTLHDVITNCSHLRLTALPASIRTDTTLLDLSHNQLTSLEDLSRVHLPQLRHLDVSHNSVRELDQQALSGLASLHSVDLSHNQMTVIWDRAFVHLTALTSLKLDHNGLNDSVTAEAFLGLSHLSHLDLSHNLLHVLHNAFSHLPRLTWLSLSSNRLHQLQAGAMLGLHTLTYLDLTFNHLQMTSQSLPPGVFAPLSSLHDLHLHHNHDSFHGEYPADVFNHLVSLRYLAPDTFSTVHFGPDFAALSRIETLDLTENCQIVQLTNDSFEGFKFSTLQKIFLSSCRHLLKMDRCVFCNLPNLRVLRITSAGFLPATTALRSLYGLRGQNMTDIHFHSIGASFSKFYRFDKETAEHVADICVTNFILRNSRIREVSVKSIPMQTSLFSHCIQSMDFSSNALVGDVRFFILALYNFRHLRTMQVQDQETKSIRKSACILATNCKLHYTGTIDMISSSNDTFNAPTPPDLVELNLAATIGHFPFIPPYIRFQPGRQLQALDLSYNGLANCLTTLLGLDNLVALKLSYNYCVKLSPTVFDRLHSLQHLELSNFGPRTSFYVSQGKRLFQHLTQLETLDLSFNDLRRLDPTMLRRQPRLTSLDLSRNRFQSVPVFLGYHSNLSFLDLSENNIPLLTASERDVADGLAASHLFRYISLCAWKYVST